MSLIFFYNLKLACLKEEVKERKKEKKKEKESEENQGNWDFQAIMDRVISK